MTVFDWYTALSVSFGTPGAIIFATHYMVEVGGWNDRLVLPAWILAGICWVAGLLVAVSV